MRCVMGLVDSGFRMDWKKERESVRSSTPKVSFSKQATTNYEASSSLNDIGHRRIWCD